VNALTGVRLGIEGAVVEDLINAASSALVTAMATDAWSWVKQGFVRIFGRAGAAPKSVENRLEASRGELVAAAGDETVRAGIESAWRTRILDIIEDDPTLMADLWALVEKARAQNWNSSLAGPIVQSAAAFDSANQAVQGSGVQSNSFGVSDGQR
jgi:hypothetical protein